MPDEVLFEREGVRLAGLEYGGDGPSALLLHGLAGHAGEWAETAGWLTERCRVVALDARGHGAIERLPPDVSPDAHVAEAPRRGRTASSTAMGAGGRASTST